MISHSCWKVKKLSPRGAQPIENAPPEKKPAYLKTASTPMCHRHASTRAVRRPRSRSPARARRASAVTPRPAASTARPLRPIPATQNHRHASVSSAAPSCRRRAPTGRQTATVTARKARKEID